ncbi:DNRLRE domain-containing protein [Microbulbifer sp. OS29]|uniref:DNRLRE domain-containing protein n=1 Tax=Microbulbifer okhotskensis TaxID=2926617 RepID=A0A9X2J3Y3_9GAMM|nr:DNRLRE domain-containing protein [Microbulbifer okhotskensis]MCO1333553.1 DNRLRE domain-containing protein [Microbulbifer okhotskensis]
MRRILSGAFSISTLIFAIDASAATKHHRLAWDGDASISAVIGFSPDGSSNNPYINFGYSTNEESWNSQSINSTYTFDGSLNSHFVRLEDLTPNSAIYYRICDQDGCGDRFWFKTAPSDKTPFVVIAGGDTRTGHTTRREGNALLAKIRPLAVMHGGDFTNANSASEMDEFLDDWALTYSDDSIDGYSYKRIYPLIPTHGNHEDGNYSTTCQVFGIDFNGDGTCNPSDTYGAVQISPLLRVYTLNSQFQDSGWSSYATAMNNWLENDLSSSGAYSNWRFAQYHKPMFPHYSGKSENPTLFNWWAHPFYDFAMNLVVESDTHLTKLTEAVAPSNNDFSISDSGGTVYVGEGSWGAPARSANDAKFWTIDMASIQQYKVIQVSPEQLIVRTAQFDNTAHTLSREERANDPIVLPQNINWWSANRIGKTMTLAQNTSGRSIIVEDGNSGSTLSLPVSDDTFISSRYASSNFNGDSDGLLADGSDSTYGSLYSLIQFDLSDLSTCSAISAVELELNITNRSSNSYGIYLAGTDWEEDSATWNTVAGSAVLSLLATSFVPSTTGILTIDLTSTGILDSWQTTGNTGLAIASLNGSNGVDITSKESGITPVLKVLAECGGNASEKVSLVASDDVFISSRAEDNNFNADGDGLLADGSDLIYGKIYSLIRFDLADLQCTQYIDATLEVNVTNTSSNSYGIYLATKDWREQTATWDSVGGDNILGLQANSFTPSSTGRHLINLQSSGIIDNWLNGNNTGLIIASEGGINGLDMSSKESGQSPLLALETVCK